MKHVNPVSHVSHAKAVVMVAANAVVVVLNAVMTHLRLTVVNKLLLPMAMHRTSVLNAPNALSSQSLLMRQRKATSPLPAKLTPTNAHPANVAAVTVMVANAVNVVTVQRHRQTKQLTPTPALKPSRLCSWSTQKPTRL